MRKLLRRYGVLRVCAMITVAAVLASIILTVVLGYTLSGGWPGWVGLTIATVVPAIIAPLGSAQMLSLLDRLDRAEGRLRELSITDEVTHAYNRRYFLSLAERELLRLKRAGGVCALAILDLDDFKEVNDSAGHLVGDEVLRLFSRLALQSLRASDTFARYGGDEFTLLLPDSGLAQAREVVERIRRTVSEIPAGSAPHGYHFHFSAGLASFDAQADSLDQVVKRADDALYAAKRAGGNQAKDEG